MTLLLAGTSVVALVALIGCFALVIRLRGLRRRYGPIVDLDAAAEASRKKLESLNAEHVRASETTTKELETLAAEYQEAKSTYDRLRREIGLLEENLEDISFGVYNPHFSFDTPELYKSEITAVRNRLKAMIRSGTSVRCDVAWTVGGSRREGERMQKQYSKLLLRAFNGECDAAVANVVWNNVLRMEERINKSFDAVNKLGGVMKISITEDCRDLRLAELRLKHEYEEKCQAQKDEQRAMRERMRDEERAQRELARAREEAEEEEAVYEKALARARAEVALAHGKDIEPLNARIAQLEQRLQLAQEQKQRAIARAQLTRSGHVYIISNIGSFGERVVKVGLTRRLEPLDRIRELSDASVPFDFDVHAILYSEDAPALEAKIHRLIEDRRINLVNMRREFFGVTIDELEELMRSHGLTAVLTKLPEAKQYRETLARRNGSAESVPAVPAAEQFPAVLRTAH